MEDSHPESGIVEPGQFLSRRTWLRHQEAQSEFDVATATESLANVTLLRTFGFQDDQEQSQSQLVAVVEDFEVERSAVKEPKRLRMCALTSEI